MRAAIYCRVSSADQRDRDTIASQLRVLPEYVRSQGWELVGTYVDDGKSAATGKLGARDGFAELARDATAKRFDILVVVDVNRLTRTEDAIERASIIGTFQRAGVRIATPGAGVLDLQTLMGELYVTMHALFAAEENRKRSESIRRGKAEAARQGRKSGGHTRYGLLFSLDQRTFSLHPEHAPIAREMVERVAAGESCRAVARDLDARGVPTIKGARFWTGNRVWDVVTSRHVVGDLELDHERKLRAAVPAIADEATWRAAQEVLRGHRKSGLRRTRHTYLLEGIAVCGDCGSRMLIRASHNNTVTTYICGARLKRNACAAPIVRVDEIDPAVWDEIRSSLRDPELPARIAADEAARGTDARDWSGDADGYRKHIDRLEQVETAIWTRFRRGSLSEARLDAELAQVKRERDSVEKQLDFARNALAQLKRDRVKVADARSIVGELGDTIDCASSEVRRSLALALIVQPVVFRGLSAHFDIVVPRARAESGGLGGQGNSGVVASGSQTTSGREILATIRVVASR